MPKSFAPAHIHAPLLPLHTSWSWSLNDDKLTPGVLVWNQHRGQEPCRKHHSKEPPRRSDRLQEPVCANQQDNVTRKTCIRSRFRVALVRQHVSSYDLNIPPTTTISLTGDFCLETRSSSCLSSQPARPVLRRCNIATLMDTQAFCLAMYFFFNLSLTLYNKIVLGRFPFPYTLTALHALCGAMGGHLLLQSGVFASTKLDLGQHIMLLAFSLLYAVNIIVSNLSLQLVTIPVSLCCLYP